MQMSAGARWQKQGNIMSRRHYLGTCHEMYMIEMTYPGLQLSRQSCLHNNVANIFPH